jgi:tripartite ATP-independent transporter DctP family solute receptor
LTNYERRKENMGKKKVLILLVASVMVLAMAGLAFAADKPIVVRLGHVGFTGSLFEKTSLYFEKIVEARTNGAVDVRVYGASQLGKDKEMMQSVRLGNLEMCAPSTVLPGSFPIFAFQELPFLFKDREHVERVLSGRVGYKLNEILEEKGLMTLGYWENGFRKITNNVRPINTPEDLKGIKLRVPKSPARVKLFRTLGANPTSMSFKEVFSALQQGVIDGQENPLAQIASAKFHEVQKYMSISNHVYTPAYPLINAKFFQGLPKDIQKVLVLAGHDAGHYARKTGAQMDKELMDMLAKKMQVNEVNFDAFVKASEPLYDDYPKEFGKDGKWILDQIVTAR